MAQYRHTHRFFSLAQARQMILEDSDTEADNVVILPPENKGDVTDEEECDEGTSIPSDVPGEVVVDYKSAESASDESDTEHTAQVTAPRKKKKLDSAQCWRKAMF